MYTLYIYTVYTVYAYTYIVPLHNSLVVGENKSMVLKQIEI